MPFNPLPFSVLIFKMWPTIISDSPTLISSPDPVERLGVFINRTYCDFERLFSWGHFVQMDGYSEEA